MKILLDHNLDWRLSRSIPNHEVKSVRQQGWDALKNGALLEEAAKEGFSVMLTADKSIEKQQRMAGRSIALIVLRAPDNQRKTHISMMREVNQVLLSIQPGEVIEVFHPDLKP